MTCTSHLINMNSETCWWLIWNYVSKKLHQKPKFLSRGPRWFRSKCCPKPEQIGREPGNTFLCTTLPCYKKCSSKQTHVTIQKCCVKQPVHQLCKTKSSKCWYNFLPWSSMSYYQEQGQVSQTQTWGKRVQYLIQANITENSKGSCILIHSPVSSNVLCTR